MFGALKRGFRSMASLILVICKEGMLLANFDRKEHLQHRAVSLRQHGFLVESCCLRPMMRNSVLEELRVRRFADIQEEMCFRAVLRWATLDSKLRGWNEKKVESSSRRLAVLYGYRSCGLPSLWIFSVRAVVVVLFFCGLTFPFYRRVLDIYLVTLTRVLVYCRKMNN